MAEFNPSRKFPTDFNKGKKYKAGDGVQALTINNLIESALWIQEIAFESGAAGIQLATYNATKMELTIEGLKITEVYDDEEK